jgi:hypothetical protein
MLRIIIIERFGRRDRTPDTRRLHEQESVRRRSAGLNYDQMQQVLERLAAMEGRE